ncbi:MAG TPA: hypothetical protein VE988_09730 [Gemmataceae bacterium]|nr:hypothetical protein [Gemmataceae bacterium]
MKRHLLRATAAGLLALLAPVVAVSQVAKTQPSVLAKHGDGDQVCTGDFGTNVRFVKTPSDAGTQALKEEKLVFVLHVSGEFEDPDFT